MSYKKVGIIKGEYIYIESYPSDVDIIGNEIRDTIEAEKLKKGSLIKIPFMRPRTGQTILITVRVEDIKVRSYD